MPRIDAACIAQLLAQHGASLVLFARQWCHDPDDALQEALLDLAQLLDAPDDCVAWLYIAVKRRAMNLSRGETRRHSRQQRASATKSESWFDNQNFHDDEQLLLQNSLSKLPALERQIVVARIWGELTFQQIATLVDTSPSSVHRFYLSALQHLREQLTSLPSSRYSEEGL